MCWQGKIDRTSWDGGIDYMKNRGRVTSTRTVPLVKWHAHDKDKRYDRQISSSWSKYREAYIANSLPVAELPYGWRHPYEATASDQEHLHKFPEYDIPEYFFKHDSDFKAEFWYPLPISQPVAVPDSSALFPFISCYTSRCWLDAAVSGCGAFSSYYNEHLWVSLRDRASAWAGALNIHSPDALGPYSGIRRSWKASQCELIAISRGYAYNRTERVHYDLAERSHEERPKSAERYEFYNVLWIEWKDGIAYRKGVGRVKKSMWEAQPLEWIQVTLG